MNTQTQEALKMAIEALDTLMMEKGSIYQKALEACKEALEQPSVAELNDEYLRDTYVEWLSQPAQEPIPLVRNKNGNFSPAPSWQGLSDDEKLAIIRKWKDAHTMREQELIGLGDAFEQALKEKNNV